jgi:transposase InsO family protein
MVILGDDYRIPAAGQGQIIVDMNTGNEIKRTVLNNVLYVPKLSGNLLSVSHFLRTGAEIRFKNEGCELIDKHGDVKCVGHMHGNLFIMDMEVVANDHVRIAAVDTFPEEDDDAPNYEDPDPAAMTVRTASKADNHIWHRRLAHLHNDAVTSMTEENMVTGMEVMKSDPPSTPCEPCVKGKQTRSEIAKTTETRADTVLGRIFSDVCGRMTRSHEGYEYFVTWTDDKSRKVFVNGLKAKSDVAEHLKVFIARAENETGRRVAALRSDGGGEYLAGTVQQYLKDKGIKHEVTTPDTPQHNGVAERMNRTLLDKVRAMLIDADLPESYWYDALLYAAHIHNVTPTRALDKMTPEEAWSGQKPDVSNLRIFGAKAFVHIPESQRGKLSARSLICTFIGFARQRKAYRLVHRQRQQFIESRDVIFDEGGTTTAERVTFKDNDDTSPSILQVLNAPNTQPTTDARPKRNVRAPIRDDDPRYSVSSYNRNPQANVANLAQADILPDPKTYAEAMKRPDAAMWELACEGEKRQFEAMGVYEVVPRPQGKKVVGSKWVFRQKRGPDGTIQKYKARVVAQGFTQVEGVDYDETFAPVAKLSSLRAILALAAELNWEVHQMDVKSAYLNGVLEEEIFMEPPPGFDVPDGMVLRLIKAVYGTKQGGRVWYKNVKAELEKMGYTRTEADHAVFVRFLDNVVSIIVLYVDDFTLVCRDISLILGDKEKLMEVYDMTDLGEIAWILGIHVTRDREAGRITLSQQRYIEEILERFGKSDVRPISTPALANEHFKKLTSAEVDVKSYQRALGALMYPMLGTRPDLAYAVGALGRHAATPGEEHERALDRVFRYLQATKDWCLVYQRGTPDGQILSGFVDADWANERSDRSSTSGYVYKLAGGAISWSSKKQSSIALSSAEAEYIAGAHAAKEAIWLRRLLTELRLLDYDPTIIHMDSQSAMAIAKNPQFHDRTKHIDVRYHFLRSKVEEEEIELEYVPTGDQVADALTKALNREKHTRFAKEMGVGRST